MIKAVLFAFLIVFAVSGICDFLFFLKIIICYPEKDFSNYVVTVLKKGTALTQLGLLSERLNWYGKGYADRIFAVVSNLDEDEINECREYVRSSNIILCGRDEISDLIAKLGCE